MSTEQLEERKNSNKVIVDTYRKMKLSSHRAYSDKEMQPYIAKTVTVLRDPKKLSLVSKKNLLKIAAIQNRFQMVPHFRFVMHFTRAMDELKTKRK